jgi:hypothetical protein
MSPQERTTTMSPFLPIPDRQIEGNVALIAAEVCAHPLVLQLPPAAVDLAVGMAAGDIRIDAHAARMLRLILIHIGDLEIAASRGVPA